MAKIKFVGDTAQKSPKLGKLIPGKTYIVSDDEVENYTRSPGFVAVPEVRETRKAKKRKRG